MHPAYGMCNHNLILSLTINLTQMHEAWDTFYKLILCAVASCNLRGTSFAMSNEVLVRNLYNGALRSVSVALVTTLIVSDYTC